jgi:hypothetical protein
LLMATAVVHFLNSLLFIFARCERMIWLQFVEPNDQSAVQHIVFGRKRIGETIAIRMISISCSNIC